MKTLFSLSILLFCLSAHAEVAVIVHPSNASSADALLIKRIFEGQLKSFSDGSSAIPISQTADLPAAEEFNSKVLKKTASQLKAYWAKIVFTGKGSPPNEVNNDAEVIKLVSTNPNLVGYVDASAVNSSVKVLATF